MTHADILETLLVATHRLTRASAQATGSSVVSATWTTLSILLSDGPRRIGELARAARISQPGMTKLLHELAARGWARRTADLGDSRASLIEITSGGRAALFAWRAELAATLAPAFADLGDREWNALRTAAELLASRTAPEAVAA